MDVFGAASGGAGAPGGGELATEVAVAVGEEPGSDPESNAVQDQGFLRATLFCRSVAAGLGEAVVVQKELRGGCQIRGN